MLIPGFYWRLAVLAACLLCIGIAARWVWKDGYRTSEREWIAKSQASEIRALKAEAERDEASRKAAIESAKALASRSAQIEVRGAEALKRVIPQLPKYDPVCNLPGAVRDSIQAEIDRVNGETAQAH